MIFSPSPRRLAPALVILTAATLLVAGCASEDVDDLTGSRMQPLPLGTDNKPIAPTEAGDIAIAAQMFSHEIRALPQVNSLTTPALVRFNGVTALIYDENHQPVAVDTQPYTTLLRDRLLLGDREKLRFVERQLPPLTTASGTGKHHHEEAASTDAGAADYEVEAELRGRANSDALRIQIEFIDIHSGSVLLNEIYRIRRESGGSPDMSGLTQSPPPAASPADSPLPTSANSPTYGNNGWNSPVPGIYDNNPTPSGQYNPPPPPQ